MWVADYARRTDPTLKIIDYVSPSVWAWRPSRARAMRRYVDHILALLPFEPDVHRKLGGPPCSYVGHPIIEQASEFRPNAEEARRREAMPPVIVVLPGSRSGEIARLAAIFGETIGRVRDRIGPIEVVVPVAPHLRDRVAAAATSWPLQPRIVTEQADKLAAFRIARAALAKSGTVTLELALAGVPMVAAYRVSALDAMIMRRVITVPSVVLANLVIGENVVPELLQENCTPERLTEALVAVIGDTPERHRQVEAFGKLDAIMQIGAAAPALRAADIVISEMRKPLLAP
jgi:lipid-A-disaccharide synthase